jgi:hypothetical protein
VSDRPVFAVPDTHLIPVAGYPAGQMTIPPSRMFMIKKGLAAYRQKVGRPDAETYDASQGDGGESLPGVPGDILEAALRLQQAQGTAYDFRTARRASGRPPPKRTGRSIRPPAGGRTTWQRCRAAVTG